MFSAYALSGPFLSNLTTNFMNGLPLNGLSFVVTGIAAGEALVGIDFRPQNGFLYGLGVNEFADTATLYAISTETGFAAPVGTPSSISFTLDGMSMADLPSLGISHYGFDFNPVADRIRVTTDTGLNFRIDPNTGAPVDGNLGGSTIAGTNPDGPINTLTTTVSEVAYTNNTPNNGGITTLYTLDAATNTLFIQNPHNAGTQTQPLPVTLDNAPLDFTFVGGFDIAGVNTPTLDAPALNGPMLTLPVTSGYGVAFLEVAGNLGLYAIDLATGAATPFGVGNLFAPGGQEWLNGLAIQNDYGGIPSVALTVDGLSLVRFSTATPGTATTRAVTGLAMNETLVGLDYRPLTGQLYALGVDSIDNLATLYRIDPQTGQATAIGSPGQISFTTNGLNPVDLPDPTTTSYGFNFDPVTDRIRVTTDTGLNFRINPSTGAPVDGDLGGSITAGTNPDGLISGLGGATGVSASAYTNGFNPVLGLPPVPTALYTLDAVNNSLYLQTPPDSGIQTAPVPVTLNGGPLDFSGITGFDIPNTVAAGLPGFGIATLNVGVSNGLYQIDLLTGAATYLGAAPTALRSLALSNIPSDMSPGPAISVTAPLSLPNAAAVDFVVVFNELAGGVDASGFSLTSTGTAQGTIGTPTTQDFGKSWYVPVTNVSGEGTLRLDFAASGTHIFGVANNLVTTDFSTGMAHTVDTVAPELRQGLSQNLASALATGTVTVTLSELVLPGTGSVYIHRASDNAVVETFSVGNGLSVSGNTLTLTLDPAISFSGGSSYYVTADSGVVWDLATNQSAAIVQADHIGFTVPVPLPPSPPPSPDTVDGVSVQTGTITNSDGTTSRTVAIPVVTASRSEAVGDNAVADIPLIQASGGGSLLTAQIPTGFGLQVTGSATARPASASFADLAREIRAHSTTGSADQDQLAGGGSGFLQNLPADAPLLVETIVPTMAPGATEAPGEPLVITAAPQAAGTPMTALVIDARGLPPGLAIQLQQVGFAALIGAMRVTGGDGAQNVWGDNDAQYILLGAGDDTLHGGASDDTVGSEGGNDQLYGDAGNDTVFGGIGNDTVFGGTGNDVLHGDAGNDSIAGGDGLDTLLLQGSSLAEYRIRAEAGQVVLTHTIAPDMTIDGTLTRLYDLFHRAPDDAGFANWKAAFGTGVPVQQIAASFASCAEFIAQYGEPGNADYIETLYQQVLGRASDAAGKAAWVGHLNQTQDRGDVLLSFVNSAEHLNAVSTGADGSDTVSGVEALHFANGTNLDFDASFVGSLVRLYGAALDRAPDQDGLNAWITAAEGGTSVSVYSRLRLWLPDGLRWLWVAGAMAPAHRCG